MKLTTWSNPRSRAPLPVFWARVFFWCSSLSVPASTVIAIAALSHVLGKSQLATISAIFAVSFVGTVLPIGIQARSAADAAAHGSAGSVRWPPIYAGTLVWIAASPLLAYALHVPLLAMLSPALGLIPSLIVGVGRGEMIGQERFVAAGANHLVEAAIRLVAGIGLGVWLGANGAALSLIICQLGAWALLPRREGVAPGFIRMPGAFGAVALMILSIQIDLLIAPRLLGSEASAYAVSALPAKAVYLALSSTAWLVVPGAVKCRKLSQAMMPLSELVAAGVVLSGLLALAAPLTGLLLGTAAPAPVLMMGLGLGMAVALGNWLLVQIRLAQAPSRLWLAPAGAVVAMVVIASLASTELGFCVGMLVGQSCALAINLAQLQIGLRRAANVPPSATTAPAAIPGFLEAP